MDNHLIKGVKSHFTEQFSQKPTLVFSPGRINLIGEHTDYNDGFVFPAAIDKGITLAISKNETNQCSVIAKDKNEACNFDLNTIAPIKNGGWRNYVLGVLSELQKLGLKVGGFNAVFAGDIPDGAGMSSSAALENSFVFGLNALFDLGLSRSEMIVVSQKAEHNYAGVKCGIMDQFASMFGVEDAALLLDCRTMESRTFRIDLNDYQLLLINTNIKHDLSESAYNDRRAVCENTSKILGIKALRDASVSDLNSITEEVSSDDFKKAQYVIEENERVQAFSAAIENNNLNELGNLLYASHAGLSAKYKVSCEELDFLVNTTKDNSKILGARMMGGGFGGCTINLISKDAVESFKKEISENYKNQFGIDCSIYSVKLSQGTRIVT